MISFKVGKLGQIREEFRLITFTWLLQVSINQEINLITAYAHF